MWHVVENTIVRVLYLDITVGNVISEPTILCVILSSWEEPMYVCNSKLDYLHICRCSALG